MPIYTFRYVVFGTRPWHEWTEHQGAPWQRAFSSRNPGGVRCIHAMDVYMLTQLLNHVSKEQCSRVEYTKTRGPGRRQFIDGGLFGALNGAGALTGPGAGVEKKKSRAPSHWPGPGGELRQGPAGFGAPEAP